MALGTGTPTQATSMGNIVREIYVDLSAGDFEDRNGFFVRSADGGYIRYWPINNVDAEYIDKEFDASKIFVDPVICRKISGVTSPVATGVYVGYGV